MKYIVAVSGGVDSVVLLGMLARGELSLSSSEPSRGDSSEDSEFIVAHFDHGIRPESDADARFVWELAKKYGLACEIRREELGEYASEALARERRYSFLREIAKKYNAKIVTAHHQDDLIETIALNLTRGTGWRGVAVMGGNEILRPLIGFSKQTLRDYAFSCHLEWTEDETNISDKYQRNRLRHRLHALPDKERQALLELWNRQLILREQIENELLHVASEGEISRYFFIMIPEAVALELLRAKTNGRLTRPQLIATLLAIKTFRSGQNFEAGDGIVLSFGHRYFTMKDLSGLI